MGCNREILYFQLFLHNLKDFLLSQMNNLNMWMCIKKGMLDFIVFVRFMGLYFHYMGGNGEILCVQLFLHFLKEFLYFFPNKQT